MRVYEYKSGLDMSGVLSGYEAADSPSDADVAIAPLLVRRLSRAELGAPRYGTLIFHPSLLPLYRGRNAIKDAMSAGERTTGVTWFWGEESLDTGPICEQAALAIPPGIRPREFYERVVLPALTATLSRALRAISAGYIRAVPQELPNGR